MGWFPVGPDFVFAPRNADFRRLSRRNEKGRQTLVTDIAIDPTWDPSIPDIEPTIYITEGVGSAGAFAGASLWRSDDGGTTWMPIGDALLQQLKNPYIDPGCVALNPSHPEIVYVGGASWWMFVSSNRGDPGFWKAAPWSPARTPGVAVRKIVVDARTAVNPATTVLYAATSDGVLRSADGGMTWDATPVVTGDAYGLVALFDPVTLTAHVYAAIWNGGSATLGLHYSTDPSLPANWSNLNDLAIGLPSRVGGTFDTVLVDLCPRNPARAYAWFLLGDTPVGLFTTVAAKTGWTKVTTTAPPLFLRRDKLSFAVAPNSAGDGATDILVLGSVTIQRSTDAGKTWKQAAVWLHVDHIAIAFAPPRPAAGIVPLTYVGTDGGVARSARFVNPAAAIDTVGPLDFHETANLPKTSHVWENRNRGRQSVEFGGYATPSSYPALSYMTSWDSGVKGGAGATWRGLWDGDTGRMAAAAGPRGIVLWSGLGLSLRLKRWVDTGGFAATLEHPTLNGANFSPTSNLVVEASGACVMGALAPAGSFVVRVPQQGNAVPISQNFAAVGTVVCVAVDPSNANALYCLTRKAGQPERLWTTTAASTATAATVWTEIATGKPAGQSGDALTVSQSGVAYVGMDHTAGQSPLYAIIGNAWVPQLSTGAPSFGSVQRLVADPIQANVLYALYGGETVYRLVLLGGTWSWQKLASDGLPGQLLLELQAARVTGAVGATTLAEKVVLRVATATRGIFEADAAPTATDPPVALYVRRNFLDTGWLDRPPAFLANPYLPAKVVTHAQCADIKFEFPQRRPTGKVKIFYESDPEWDPAGPLDHVMFEELSERSTGVESGRALRVHVQVHNRARTPASNVSVWTLYTTAAAGLPALDQTASGTSFWTQFTASGAIVPALPATSSWKPVGPPLVLSAVDAAHPRVASWTWVPPGLGPHRRCRTYTVLTLLHSQADPVGETTRINVDDITVTNRRVGLKNVTVCRPLRPWRPKPHYRKPKPPWGSKFASRVYVEFHNARAAVGDVDLLLDLRTLPRELGVWFQLTKPERDQPWTRSMVGAREVGRAEASMAETLLAQFVDMLQRPWRRPSPAPHLPPSAFAPAVYEAEAGTLVEVGGIRLGPRGRGALLFSIAPTAPLEPGAAFAFDVFQRRADGDAEPMIVGAATILVTTAGERQRSVDPDRPLEDEGSRPDSDVGD